MSVPETPRKAIPKRLRFEVMRRDNHACRYCGGTAPDVKLTIDHVVPVALGGSDEPTNLVTACTACNAGKASMPADAALIDDVAHDAARWSAAMRLAADAVADEFIERQKLYRNVLAAWEEWTQVSWNSKGESWPLPDNWTSSIDQFISAGAETWVLADAIDIAMRSHSPDKWRYFCGVSWNKVRALQQAARDILDAEESPRGA